jgi:hypothetical protein
MKAGTNPQPKPDRPMPMPTNPVKPLKPKLEK